MTDEERENTCPYCGFELSECSCEDPNIEVDESGCEKEYEGTEEDCEESCPECGYILEDCECEGEDEAEDEDDDE